MNLIPLNSSDCSKGQSAGVSEFHTNDSYLRISGFNSAVCDFAIKPANTAKVKVKVSLNSLIIHEFLFSNLFLSLIGIIIVNHFPDSFEMTESIFNIREKVTPFYPFIPGEYCD